MNDRVKVLINDKTYEIYSKYLKKSKFQKKISNKIALCLNCEKKCKIQLGKTGFCNTRINYNAEVYTIIYGAIIAKSINPIEKKPFFHFHPGSRALTIGTHGCNFNCFWCQNHHISHPKIEFYDSLNLKGGYYSPKMLISEAILNNCQGISISFNEPTLLSEYSLKAFELAKKEGLYTSFVSNGYMTENVLRALIRSGLDAIQIDIKGGMEMVKNYCKADVEKVWNNAILAKKLGIHVEITTLLIENLNTNGHIIQAIAKKIRDELGDDTPYHITRFFPHYKSLNYGYFLPTSEMTLRKSYKVAKAVGLKYVYLGNFSPTEYENTICPNCLKVVIKRKIIGIEKIELDFQGNCKYCGYSICKM